MACGALALHGVGPSMPIPVPAGASGTVTLTVRVNKGALTDLVIDNQAFVRMDEEPWQPTEQPSNPLRTPTIWPDNPNAVPKTGDDNPLTLPAVLVGVAAMTLIVAAWLLLRGGPASARSDHSRRR